MLKRRALVMFIIALGMGIAAAWVANNWLQMRSVMPTAGAAATTPVVVAALKIPYGQKVEDIHVKTVNLPAGTVPEGTYNDTAQVLGKIANQTIIPGEFLVNGRVVDQLGGSTLSALVSPQMRAVTVRVNDVIGVAGFLLPGNRVDVVSTRKEGRQALARTILQDIKVLAVDQTASPDKDQPVIVRAVTLEMNPREAETLVKATTEGSVQLTLRNPGDTKLVMLEEKAAEKPQPVARKISKPAPRAHFVTIVRGTEESKTKL